MAITLKKLAPNIGVEVEGLDVSKGVDAATAQQLRDALDKYYVVLLRNQKITPAQQVAYASVYGSPESLNGYGGAKNVNASNKELPKEVFQITNDPATVNAKVLKGAARWHTDLTWSKLPSKAAVLHVQTVPSDEGSGTNWCALYAAYDDLPEAKKAQLKNLKVVHCVEAAQRLDHPNPSEEDLALWRRVPPIEHPLVWTHADGRKSLVLGPTADHIVGIPKAESDALLKELEEWCIQPKYTYNHRWTVNDLLVWFNSATMHHAVEYNGPELRLMHRITVTGEEEIS